MKLDKIFQPKSSLETFFQTKNFELKIKKEYESFLSFGTKLRKFSGLNEFLKSKNTKEVLIYGNPHSNFVSTYTYLFKIFNYKINSIFYSFDKDKNSLNSFLSKNYSDEFQFIQSKNNLEYYLNLFSKKENLFIVPEFGIHTSSIYSLNQLWKEIENFEFEYLFLDIGTGFTSLTALEYFKDKKLIGVSIGQDEKKIYKYLENLSKKLNLEKSNLSRLKIIPPVISKSFGSTNKELDEFVKTTFLTTGFFLEPIYSAKSIYTIQKYIKKNLPNGKGIYIHQGGILNHLKYYI